MKAAFCAAFLSIAAVAGCATTQPSQEAAPQAQALTPEEAYIARVEQIARRRGLGVTWVNMPKFRKEAAVAKE